MSNKKAPAFLQKGDKIAIVSTARSIRQAEIQPSVKLFESWGLKVFIGDHIHSVDRQFAGTDDDRLADLQKAMDDPEVKAIVCSRGGYGTARLLDKLDLGQFRNSPKWVVGYSDITALHLHMYNHTDWCTIHGTMPININSTPTDAQQLSISSLRDLLFGKKKSYQLVNHPLNRPGDMSGTVLGGNLSMIYSLLGSPSCPDFESCILFLEDLDEYLYHVDRMMLNIKRNGILDKLSGVLVGSMSDMNDNTIPFGKTAEEIISEHLAEFDYPVYFGFPAGHQDLNLAMPFGSKCVVEQNKFTPVVI